MTFKPADMEDCSPKCKCLSGANAGTVYPCRKPCEDDYVFQGTDCSCQPSFCTTKKVFNYVISRSSGGNTLGFNSTVPPTWEYNGTSWTFVTTGCLVESTTDVQGEEDEVFTIIDEQVGNECGVGQCYAAQIYKYYDYVGVAAYGVGYSICRVETGNQHNACAVEGRQIPCFVTYEWVDGGTGTATTDSPTALCDAVPREADFEVKLLQVTKHYDNYDDEVLIVDSFQTATLVDKNLGDGTQWDARLNGNVRILRSDYGGCGYEAIFEYEEKVCEQLDGTSGNCPCDLEDPLLDLQGDSLPCADSYNDCL